jgi:hypothetical protein
MWPIAKRYRLAIIGIAYLLVFVCIRAAGFIHRLRVLNKDHDTALHVGLELGGVVMIALAAMRVRGRVREK